ncbi:MAG: hypothetical protein AB7D57_01605 [Desulfovibrionaceae bacterium]
MRRIRAALFVLCLACVPWVPASARAQAAAPDTAPDAAPTAPHLASLHERLEEGCMQAEGDQAYCDCSSALFEAGLTPAELSRFVDYLEAGDEQESDRLHAALPQAKVQAILAQAEKHCRPKAEAAATAGLPPRDRLLKVCLDSGQEPAYCRCSVDQVMASLSDQEAALFADYLENNDPATDEAMVSRLDMEGIQELFAQAERHCLAGGEVRAAKTRLVDAKVRLVRTCVAGGDDPGVCQCFANTLAEHLGPDGVERLLDALDAEAEGDAKRADELRRSLDPGKLATAYEVARSRCVPEP